MKTDNGLKCSICGRTYENTYSSCPHCSGLGDIPANCKCSYIQNSLGLRLNILHKKDPACPVHRGK
jgi:hypothetical protein